MYLLVRAPWALDITSATLPTFPSCSRASLYVSSRSPKTSTALITIPMTKPSAIVRQTRRRARLTARVTRSLPPVEDPPTSIADLAPSLPMVLQGSCPLFTVVPAETRNRIYEFSLESDDSTDAAHPSPYRRHTFYYRPGHKRPKHISTSLLQTCQQIYAEASLLPPVINEHTFWCNRPPPHVKNASSPVEYFKKMTLKQRSAVQSLHFFTQQFFLEGNWGGIWTTLWRHQDELLRNTAEMGAVNKDPRSAEKQVGKIAPKKITITLRHTDWWHWENNERLGIDPFRNGRTFAAEMGAPVPPSREEKAWGNEFKLIPSLEELVIEFETVMRKKDQLDAILERALEWKFPLHPKNCLYLVAEPRSKRAYTWIGAKESALKQQEPHAMIRNPETGRLELQAQLDGVPAPTLIPFDTEIASKTAGGSGEGSITGNVPSGSSRVAKQQPKFDPDTEEEFYVVFLIWKRQRVERRR